MALAAVFLCYSATLKFAFVYDDLPQIVANPRIHSVHFLPEYFVKDVWAHQQGRPQNLYRPLFLIWLLANFKSFNLQPTYWHLAAVLMHLLMVLLVYFLARRLLPESQLAAPLAAALFALHPLHVEAVAWISGVTEPLSATLFVSSFLCYLKGRDQSQKGALWIVASLLLAASAMLSKETAVVLPAVIVCYEWLLPKTGPRRRWLTVAASLWPYAVLLGVYLVLRLIALHGVAHSFSDVPRWKSLLALPWVLYFYVSQLLVPTGLGPYYDATYASGFNAVIPALILAALMTATWWWSRKLGTRLPLFLASWFFLTLAPALAVFTAVWRYDNLHDRYLYLPSVAIAILASHIVTSADDRLSRYRKLSLRAGVLVVIASLAISTYMQTFYWKDNLALYARGVAVAPHNLMARLNLASALFENHRYDEAFAAAQEALQIDPNSPLALTDVAEAAYYRGDYAAAETYYSRALASAPPSVDQVYYLALARIRMRRYQDALLVLEKGVSLWPNASGYHEAMGEALAGMGEWAAARDQYKLELKLNPASKQAQAQLSATETHLRSLPAGK